MLPALLDPLQFQNPKPIFWQGSYHRKEDVSSIWRDNEIDNKHWQKFWTERGFNSWYEFRRRYIVQIELLAKNWYIVRVVNPLAVIPQFFGGPYQAWRKKYYRGKDFARFSEMDYPSSASKYLNKFPKKTTLIAWYNERGIFVIEGMHRCCAVSLAILNNQSVNSDISLAVAYCPWVEMPDFDNPVRTF